MSEHQNTAHLGCFCTYSQRFANWSCTIQKCVHFCYCWKIKKKKRDCNDSTVWATSRWQQSLRHLTMRLLKTLQKKKKDLHSRETHCILIDSFCFVLVLFCFFILLLVNRCCGLFTFQMCCLWIALMVYIYANSCVFWSLFFVTIFFHVWIKLLFITQTCWTFFFFFF